MSAVFVDTNIPMYAGGGPHPLQEPAQRIIRAIAAGALDAVTDAEVFQEILYRYHYIGETEKGWRIFDHFYRIMEGRILPVRDVDLREARGWAERQVGLSPRDLVHLGVMLQNGVKEIITADQAFGAVAEVRRVDPARFGAGGEV